MLENGCFSDCSDRSSEHKLNGMHRNSRMYDVGTWGNAVSCGLVHAYFRLRGYRHALTDLHASCPPSMTIVNFQLTIPTTSSSSPALQQHGVRTSRRV